MPENRYLLDIFLYNSYVVPLLYLEYTDQSLLTPNNDYIIL